MINTCYSQDSINHLLNLFMKLLLELLVCFPIHFSIRRILLTSHYLSFLLPRTSFAIYNCLNPDLELLIFIESFQLVILNYLTPYSQLYLQAGNSMDQYCQALLPLSFLIVIFIQQFDCQRDTSMSSHRPYAIYIHLQLRYPYNSYPLTTDWQ